MKNNTSVFIGIHKNIAVRMASDLQHQGLTGNLARIRLTYSQIVPVREVDADITRWGGGVWQATFTAPATAGAYQLQARTFGLNDPLIPDNVSSFDGMPNGYDKTPDDRRMVTLTVQ